MDDFVFSFFKADSISALTGHGMIHKIQELYASIVHNWLPGDQILLFGFSRGAFIARMIGALIGDVGILHPTEMDGFCDLFKAYQVLGVNGADDGAKQQANKILSLYRKGGSKATRVIPEGTLKCIGVWDTVCALGMPRYGEGDSHPSYLGFSDDMLGNHIQFCFHALAIDEHRGDFLPTKWGQNPEQRRAGQVLKQVWFPGSHSDVGGGYAEHELSDIALMWMVANVIENKLLAIDTQFVLSIPAPLYGWGKMASHNDGTSDGEMKVFGSDR
ncbi:uncharacterized protein MELLADRAFT_101223 [Melampsora larici-populina 98AG31]|uniref:T6SS Phospholipase effector Tle1-like catalytic domain-containing protein n=1 Tax=Melampsora larici-populina (strain 98AG31 / pathotype 3-4-7) TaxID=747676 RepID=F4R415_MELLP|nr:uncharacterized protein MELLADRAFT_101223 [Melampsora larici-populina 98AG31]EGG13069.1 hypothetical protein MELLADRAFT_101223 [Melampsora larici-populina 98AG31]